WVGIAKKSSLVGMGLMGIVGVALFTTFSFTGSNWTSGINASGAITKPVILKSKNQLSLEEVNNFKEILINELGVENSEISTRTVNEVGDKYLIEIITTKEIDNLKIIALSNQGLELVTYSVLFESANKAILNILYISLASILAMSIFVLFRSDWSFALPMFIGLTIGVLFFVILFTFQIFTFNGFFIFGLASAILIAISNNITVLFRIKEKLKNRKTEELVKSELKEISDVAVKDSAKRLLISNGLLVAILLIFSFIPGSAPLLFTIPLIIFILISLIISVIIIPFLFNIFKAFKSKRKRNKILNNYWETQIIQEQVFPSVNDIN
ncbi:MAG: hypothetical protein ACRC63_03320, partial [Metamycoplasmataceae bacterium]